MIAPGRVLRALVVAAAAYVVADALSHHLLREPRHAPDHRMGADGSDPATRPPGTGSSR